jgi:hypothetical protein
MAEVKTPKVDAKTVPVTLNLSRVKIGKNCWATEESITVKQWISLSELIFEQQ